MQVTVMNGTSRQTASKYFSSLYNSKAEIKVGIGTEIFLVLQPLKDTNRFYFKYSLQGQVALKSQLLGYYSHYEMYFLYIGSGMVILGLLVCLFCLMRFYGKKTALKPSNKLIEKKLKDTLKQREIETRLDAVQLEVGEMDLVTQNDEEVTKAAAQNAKENEADGIPMVDLFFPPAKEEGATKEILTAGQNYNT